MAANIRYRSTFYNTTITGSGGTPITRKIEILDTESVAGVVNFEGVGLDMSFEGLSQDLKPGVQTSSIQFGMYLRTTPEAKKGVTYGITDDILVDIAGAVEGRFLVAVYDNDVLKFIGPMIYDQCTWSDESVPLMRITAVCGLTRWSTEDYISEVGQIVYYSKSGAISPYDTFPPGFDGPEATDWIVVEHKVTQVAFLWWSTTTWARREVYSKNSPGAGWTSVGGGKWVKKLTYTNETEEEDPGVSYLFTRDIDDEKHRTLIEFFTRGMEKTKMTGEYPDPDVMFDTSIEWYEHDMKNFTDDPATMARIHEGPMIGKSWMDAMTEICKTFYLRIYYSNGRYHFEQISLRDVEDFPRFIYKADGTSAGAAETTALDISFTTMEIDPETGGNHRFIAPFKSVEAFISLDNANLLDGVRWGTGQMGMKYLGRIKRSTGTQAMRVVTTFDVTSTFDPAILQILDPGLVNSLCKHTVKVIFQVRLTNVELGTVYYLDVVSGDGEWTIVPTEFSRSVPFGVGSTIYTNDKYGFTKSLANGFTTEDIPDPENAMYDVHMSVTFSIEWDNANAATLWDTNNPDKHWHVVETVGEFGKNENEMRFYSDLSTNPYTEHPDTIAQGKTYFIENDVENSVKVKVELQWGDTNQFEKAIQILNEDDLWINSKGWSINGAGDPVELGMLWVTEVMSLRVVPRRVYTGTFISSILAAENRLLKGTKYYLPLNCTTNASYDGFQGDFLEIDKTEPPEGGILSDPLDGAPLPGLTGFDNPEGGGEEEEDQLYFETDEAITASDVLTECDIINTQGWSISAGNTVKILNLATNASETVTLTADIEPGSTLMEFESHAFVFSFPDGSPIIINAVEPPPFSSLSKYHYTNKNYTSGEHVVSQFPFSVLDGMNNNQRDKKVHVYRNGQKLICIHGETVDPNPMYWDYDTDDTKFTFPIAFDGEAIVIDVDLKR